MAKRRNYPYLRVDDVRRVRDLRRRGVRFPARRRRRQRVRGYGLLRGFESRQGAGVYVSASWIFSIFPEQPRFACHRTHRVRLPLGGVPSRGRYSDVQNSADPRRSPRARRGDVDKGEG